MIAIKYGNTNLKFKMVEPLKGKQRVNLANYLDSVRLDVDNDTEKRNTRNSPLERYNCGGYALSTFTWVCPYVSFYTKQYESITKHGIEELAYNETTREDLMYSMYYKGALISEIESTILQKDVKYLLQRYPFLEQVDINEVDKSVPLIAYRIFVKEQFENELDSDFHFKRRKNGIWSEKMGAHCIRDCRLQKDRPWVYSSNDTVYDSDIIYFINKRELTPST